MVEAEANKVRMKNRPRFLSGPHAKLPEAERLAGHNGTVIVSGIVDVSGNFTEIRLRQSTGAPVLDQLALDAAKATRFTPASDESGTPLSVPVSMPFEFYASQSSEPGGGLVHYRCDQFVRDTDWWHSTHPEAKWSDYKLYTFMVGFAVLSNQNKNPVERFKAGGLIREQWPHWIQACREHPDQLFIDQTDYLAPLLHAVAKVGSEKRK